ncbi:MAG: SDR family oxidoreductase [Myxococcota bacterium]|nr:SDR family oxidoreductase [Myxococcota bacterium]
MRFEDRSVVVTGAASGFGEAIARAFAEEGASVLLTDVDEGRGKQIASELQGAGRRAEFLRVDVSSADDVQAMVDRAVAAHGGLDVLVNNAGFSHHTCALWKLDEADYDRVFAVNTKGVFLGCKAAIPLMKKAGGGVIVNTASIGAVAPRPGVTVYNATKGAVMTMTRGLAAEVAPLGIRVNAVNPVAAETGFIKGSLGSETLSDDMRATLTATIPMGRLCEPQDVAAAVLFLASDEARFLTGVCLPVDGGRSIS